MVRKNELRNIKRIYGIDDVFSIFGYALLWMGILASFTNLNITAIPVDSFWSVVKGLFSTTIGNLISLGLGFASMLVGKYIKFGRIY